MSDANRTVVIGGGVIGAMCAYFLAKSGRAVTMVDQNAFGSGCSHGNCGYVSPSHVLPLCQPGALRNTLKVMFKKNSPFYIKPRLSPSLWSWFYKFSRQCNRRDMLATAAARHALLESSANLYPQILRDENIECEFENVGLLFVFLSQHHFDDYAATNTLLTDEFGVSATPYDRDGLVALEPALKPVAAGAWHYECDSHLRPDRLLKGLRTVLTNLGVEIQENVQVQALRGEAGDCVACETSTGEIEGTSFVVATGPLTPFLNQHLGCRIPIQPGKGYSLTMPRPDNCPKIPMIFEEHRVAITPMQTGYRIGSTMEFAGYDTNLNRGRLNMLKSGAAHYLQDPYCETVEEEWFGWRPMTYDGRPFIDWTPKYSNVMLAAGHNMLGLSMATGTGKLVSELMNRETPHIDPSYYSLARMR